MTTHKNRKSKVIIIGAGIAGLAASLRLQDAGFDTMILEARDRAGGRIWTNNQLGRPIGCGASWIHGIDHNPMYQLAQQFHVNMVPFDVNGITVFDRMGKRIVQEEIDQFNTKFNNLLQKAKDIAFQSKIDIPLSAALEPFIKDENFSSHEQDLFKRKLHFFEGYIGAGYEYLSARHWDQEEIWPGENCYLIDTYQPIIDGLSKHCFIQFNSNVTEINMIPNQVQIVTDKLIFHADAVIVTVPLGVLKKDKIKFNPPLPSQKQIAIRNLEMGLLNITTLKFPKAFWPKEPKFIFFSSFYGSSICAFFNFYHYTDEPILMGYMGGESAHSLEHMSDGEVIHKTLHNLKTIYGDEVVQPEGCINTRWGLDPWSYGSYSYLKPGASAHDYEVMAESIDDRLFFAGEACSKYLATTHGAYLSGIREAERIIKIL